MASLRKLALRVARKAATPLLPARRRLPFHYWLLLRDDCENELRYLDQIPLADGIAIDVGANEGMFAYRMSQRFRQVYAFEVNSELTKDLAAYNPGNIEIIHKGLSSRNGPATLYIPVSNGVPLVGWASLAPGSCPDTQEHLEKSVEICRLDDFDLHAVSLIKIDVEGHEAEVLKGARATIAANRPCVLVEVKDCHLAEVSAFFAELHYHRQRLRDLVGQEGSAENYFFLPDNGA